MMQIHFLDSSKRILLTNHRPPSTCRESYPKSVNYRISSRWVYRTIPIIEFESFVCSIFPITHKPSWSSLVKQPRLDVIYLASDRKGLHIERWIWEGQETETQMPYYILKTNGPWIQIEMQQRRDSLPVPSTRGFDYHVVFTPLVPPEKSKRPIISCSPIGD